MKQDKLIEELRAQRELIRKHLEWLDQKISALQSDDEVDRPSTAEDSSKPEVPSGPTELDVSVANAPTPLPETQDGLPDVNLSRYQAPRGNEILRAKIGCLVLFGLSTLLFLFLLFGLPYFMD